MKFIAILSIATAAQAIRLNQKAQQGPQEPRPLSEGEGPQSIVDEIISQLDQNGDSELSRKEVRDGFVKIADEIFNATDANNDGTVNRTELENIMLGEDENSEDEE